MTADEFMKMSPDERARWIHETPHAEVRAFGRESGWDTGADNPWAQAHAAAHALESAEHRHHADHGASVAGTLHDLRKLGMTEQRDALMRAIEAMRAADRIAKAAIAEMRP